MILSVTDMGTKLTLVWNVLARHFPKIVASPPKYWKKAHTVKNGIRISLPHGSMQILLVKIISSMLLRMHLKFHCSTETTGFANILIWSGGLIWCSKQSLLHFQIAGDPRRLLCRGIVAEVRGTGCQVIWGVSKPWIFSWSYFRQSAPSSWSLNPSY